MILDSLLAGMMVFGSFAMRTPNVETVVEDDYEFSFGIQKSNFYINRQWERELGEKYIDDLVWYKYEHKFLYFKPEYMNKESHDISYVKADYRFPFKGANFGFTTRSINENFEEFETFASVGYEKSFKFFNDKFEVEGSFDGYLAPDEMGETSLDYFEYETGLKSSWALTEKVRLYQLGEWAKLQGSDHYKAKIGIEVSL